MSTRQIFELGLMLGGAALGATGALLIEPLMIGAGVVAAATVAVMRFHDQRSRQAAISSASTRFIRTVK
jgi:hypothetical protein